MNESDSDLDLDSDSGESDLGGAVANTEVYVQEEAKEVKPAAKPVGKAAGRLPKK
jgi:hypothetical protein